MGGCLVGLVTSLQRKERRLSGMLFYTSVFSLVLFLCLECSVCPQLFHFLPNLLFTLEVISVSGKAPAREPASPPTPPPHYCTLQTDTLNSGLTLKLRPRMLYHFEFLAKST